MTIESLYDFSFLNLQSRLESAGVRPVHAVQLWRALYHDLESQPAAREDFSPPLKRWLQDSYGRAFTLTKTSVSEHISSSDGLTRKLLIRLHDGQEIETVVMGYTGRFTACISSQAGCAMGCVFCATGQMGFVRHLTSGEIVAQVVEAQRLLRSEGQKLRNLVLMGMGEPLHNYDAVMEALGSVCHLPGLGIAASRISVSTVGVVPGIIRFTEERLPYSLAISLHAATDDARSKLLPINQRWPLEALMEACRYYSERLQRKVFFGWTLIAGQNDSLDHARVLAELLRGLNAHVNLIRLNHTAGFSGRTSADAAANAFHQAIQSAGIPCTIRQFRGIDVAAGCGQLRATRVAPDRSTRAGAREENAV